MPETHWDDVKQLFIGMLQQPPVEREAWLAAACADVDRRRVVLALIESLDQAGDFLEQPAHLPCDALLGEESRRRFKSHDMVGRYEIRELTGTGGMGEVYRARDTRLDRDVVLKVLPAGAALRPQWRARLEREARAVSSLNHPNVCALFDIGQHEDLDFLVLEYLEGQTLAERLTRGPLPVEELLASGQQIADALCAAHQHGIVHRDLKPANIMLTPAGVKLLDFGIAKSSGGDPSSAGSDASGPLTEHGEVIGTAAYMAPEQVRGELVDGRTDLFAFGAVLYEMLTGRKAFDGATRSEVFAAICDRDVPPMRTTGRVPRALERVVRKCLAKEASARYQTAVDLRHDLARVAARRHLMRRVGWATVAAVPLMVGIAVAVSYSPINQAPASIAISQPIVLAVLPFANQSGDSDQEYLSQGLTDEIASELARLQPDRLRVIPRTTTTRYHQSDRDKSQIGRELGVGYFIEGTTARAGEKIRIGVRLARASDLTEVWSQHYERNLEEIPIVEADVARSIASEVSLILRPEHRARLDRRAAIDPEAYERYLRGRFFLEKRTEQGLRRAVDEFEVATQRYPQYAAAYAGIAGSYILLAYYAYLPPDQAYALARAASTTAVKLDDQLAEAHVMLAGVYDGYDHQWRTAETEYREALRLNPNYSTAHQWYANLLIGLGRRKEAQSHILRARELDPLSLIIQVNVANIFLLSREYDRARQECRKALEMDENFVTARWVLGRAEELSGHYHNAIAEFERGLKLEPENTVLRASLARAHAGAGATAKAKQILRELDRTNTRRYVSALDLASVHAALNRHDKGFAFLERAVRERANRIVFLNVDPAYDTLRSDPRFGQILRSINLN